MSLRHYFYPAILRSTAKNVIHWLRLDDAKYYTMALSRPLYRPYLGDAEFRSVYRTIAPHTLVSDDRCHILYTLAKNALNVHGEFWECGVYKGGTAVLLAKVLSSAANEDARRLRLFDTFEGMPENNCALDSYAAGELNETSYEHVARLLNTNTEYKHIDIIKGLIPHTFNGLEDAGIALAHVDVDIYQSVKDCCEYIYPRLAKGGYMLFDDYCFPSCAGARKAVDEFFRSQPEMPIILPTGQAFIVKQ
jgi:O-methyltransferase